jgi:hypothetical protein
MSPCYSCDLRERVVALMLRDVEESCGLAFADRGIRGEQVVQTTGSDGKPTEKYPRPLGD